MCQTGEGVGDIIHHNHIRICTKIGLLSCCGSYKFAFKTTFLFPRMEIRIHLHSMRSCGQKASIIVTLAKHTDHQDWSWGVVWILVLVSSCRQVLAGISHGRLPLAWLIDGCRLRKCIASPYSKMTFNRLPLAWLIDGSGRYFDAAW